jgi:hypothetical protein
MAAAQKMFKWNKSSERKILSRGDFIPLLADILAKVPGPLDPPQPLAIGLATSSFIDDRDAGSGGYGRLDGIGTSSGRSGT